LFTHTGQVLFADSILYLIDEKLFKSIYHESTHCVYCQRDAYQLDQELIRECEGSFQKPKEKIIFLPKMGKKGIG